MPTHALHALLLCLLTPLAALAQESEGTRGGPFWYFWLGMMVLILGVWAWRILAKRRTPPIDPRQHQG